MESERAEHRVFFALWPAPEAAGRLHAAACAAQGLMGGRVTRRGDLHVTLAFLGDVSSARLAAAEAVADRVLTPAFDLELDRIAWWKHNRILWAGASVAPTSLIELAGVLAAGLRADGFVLDDRPYAVHATLVRNARGPVPVRELIPPVRWPVGEFVLAESASVGGGARYAIRRRWPLVRG